MKNVLNKVASVLKFIFGWGVMLSLFAGGLTFFGYLVALIIGGGEGGIGAEICRVISKEITPVITYVSTSCVLLGLLTMYLSGEQALTVGKKESSKHEGEM